MRACNASLSCRATARFSTASRKRRLHLRTLALLLGLLATGAPRAGLATPAGDVHRGASLSAAHDSPLPFLASAAPSLVAPAHESGAPPVLQRGSPLRHGAPRSRVGTQPCESQAQLVRFDWSWYAVREHRLGTPPPHHAHAG